MAKHRVVVEIPPRELNRADAVFKVKGDGKMIGTLKVSNGSVVWFPRYASYGLKMGWKKFEEVFEQNASRLEMR